MAVDRHVADRVSPQVQRQQWPNCSQFFLIVPILFAGMFRHEQVDCMERLLTTQDLADVTGLAVQTIYNRHSNGGSLPACLNLGGRLRFRQCDVDTWLDTHYEKHQPKSVTAGCSETTPRRPGRPTKAEQVARRAGKIASNLRTLH